MIIKKMWIESSESRSKLCAEILISKDAVERWKKNSRAIDKNIGLRYRMDEFKSEDRFVMWYSVPNEYAYSLCSERADAFMVACLYFAMLSEEDLISEVPVTSALLYQLEYMINRAMHKTSGLKKISVKGLPADPVEKSEHFNGTGGSCGVDSFTSILLGLEKDVPDSHRLTHLVVCNTGALNFDGYGADIPLSEWRKKTEKEFSERIEIAKNAAKELSLKVVDIDSNVSEFYQGAFLFSHSYRNCSAVLATQKMWSNYYYSSAGHGVYIDVNLESLAAGADLVVLPNISIPGLQFYSGGSEMSRFDKTMYIADNSTVQRYLNVCSYDTVNCGHCDKCERTMIILDLLGKLDNFHEAFKDREYFYKKRWKLMGRILDAKKDDLFYNEMKNYVRDNKIKLGAKAWIYHFLYPVRRLRWMLVKLLKRG